MKSRGLIIAANLKMNHGPKETEAYLKEWAGLRVGTQARAAVDLGRNTAHVAKPFGTSGLSIVFFPSFLNISSFQMVGGSGASASGPTYEVGAQNAHHELSGAFTGEVSGPQLQAIAINRVLIGHSERRKIFLESDEFLSKKLQSLLKQNFKVMFCVGETLDERNQGATNTVLKRQLEGVIPHFIQGKVEIAYEPVWAIGTGVVAEPAQAEEAHQHIRKLLWEMGGMEIASKTPILYGGSVNAKNAKGLLNLPNVDGALVGGASLKVGDFWPIVLAAKELLEVRP